MIRRASSPFYASRRAALRATSQQARSGSGYGDASPPATIHADIPERVDVVGVLAVTVEDQLLLSRSSTALSSLLSRPIAQHEVPSQAARRVLLEMAGLVAPHLTPLGRMVLTLGVVTETLHLFLARDLDLPELHSRGGRGQCLDVMERTVAWQQALRGAFDDAALQFALLSASAHQLL